jgi:enamine deaminase RidA (YjgF/YER057c/UK114 family)
MSIERKHTNARMSHIVVDGGTVYLAGQVAREGSGTTVADQTRDILARIDELLAEAGSDRSRLLTTTIWLKDISTFDEMNSVWDKWVPEGQAPARACIEAKFPFERVLVEIMVSAKLA